MCATQMNTSDNPGLWDIQLSTWLSCEFNATVMSLFNRVVLVFMHHTRCMRRRFWLDIRYMRELSPGIGSRLPVTIHALVTNDSAGYSTCDRPRTHAIAITSDYSLTGQTAIFTITSHFPHEETRDWTHTHTHTATSCDNERRIRLPGYDFYTVQSFQCFTLTSEAS